ncbi:hypothetical protein HMPREF1333_02332 [Enterococcus faecalis ERV37]|nr:hypothetical protein HMPREF1333_02332 [Enterococcus faecalis ERV37]EJV26573.1 hypothetical protein HMPREF1340_02296 [Enterococcus faecalis ERV73]EJV31163.1 hypothetical protein HMPREF1342_03015 [Enterococcus faecalis ERV85]
MRQRFLSNNFVSWCPSNLIKLDFIPFYFKVSINTSFNFYKKMNLTIEIY